MSLPLSGPSAALGREVLLGAELAHAQRGRPVELVTLDSFSAERDEQALANARRAAEDDAALAYIGDFHSSQVLVTAPVLGDAELLQIAPVATFVGLHGATLVRLMPNDEGGAHAIAAWLEDVGVRSVLVVHDHDDSYGRPVGAMCADAARGPGLAVRVQPVWDDPPERAHLADATAVVYAGVAGPGIASFWESLHELDPAVWLIGTDGIAVPHLAQELSPAAAAKTRLFVANHAPLAFYGFEAKAVGLEAIDDRRRDREAVVRAARATRDRESALGTYSLDESGLTTTADYGRLAIVGHQLVWDLA